MNIILGVILGLVILTILVLAHEFGHFIMARKNGVNVLEFGIGFPPRAIAWKKGKDGKWHKLPKKDWPEPGKGADSLILSINWLPLGGFCQMDGETGNDTRKGTFGAASFWSKTKILFAGVTMNWLFAFLVLTILAWVGMPQFIDHQFSIDSDATLSGSPIEIVSVLDNSPASAAGIAEGDIITKACSGNECVDITGSTNFIDFNEAHAGHTVTYFATNGDNKRELTIDLNPSTSEYRLGVTMSARQSFARYTWSAPLVGLGTTAQLTGETFKGLWNMVWNFATGVVRQVSFDSSTREEGREAISSAGDSVTGPVGMLGTLFPSFVGTGFSNIAFLAALISVSLACMNVLPIPALDGGRWLLILIYKLRKKPLTKEIEERIIGKAFMFLLILIAVITILDIIRLF